MGNGLERIFDLVQAAFWREDGGLGEECQFNALLTGGIMKIPQPTLESYLRDILKA